MQHYVIKFVSDLWQVSDFLQVLRFPPPINLTAAEILLKVMLNTRTLTVVASQALDTISIESLIQSMIKKMSMSH